jgi:carbamoyl-phosphate synthase large subunit
VRAFREALARTGGGRVVAADTDPRAAALLEADAGRIIPRSDDPRFVPALLRVCRDERIGLLIPTRDDELPVLAEARGTFAENGTLVLVSDPVAVDTCRDKRRFVDAVLAAGLSAPRTFDDSASARLPAFVKPRVGKGGHGTRVVASAAALAAALAELGADAIVQEVVEAPEYTIDLFVAFDGRPISCVPRERVTVVAGESVVSRTVRDAGLTEACLRLASAIGLVGHVTIQAFRTPERVVFIEVNPRYGGAANLGFAAGAPTPEFAIRMARGERVESRLESYDDDLVMLRHAEDRFVHSAELDWPEVP